MPAKGTRNPYTKEDDEELWKWVTAHERKGGAVQGNEIYKQLEEVVRATQSWCSRSSALLNCLQNPRHPWQSWRDRWIKHLSSRPRPTQAGEDTSRAPKAKEESSANKAFDRKQDRVSKDRRKDKVKFTADDALTLLGHSEDILDIDTNNLPDAWAKYAKLVSSLKRLDWPVGLKSMYL